MANIDNPSGFELVSGPAETLPISVAAANATTIGKGDPLTMHQDGVFTRSVAGAGAAVAYIAQGFKNSNGESIAYLPASTAGTITAIRIVPGQVWAVQGNSGTAITAAAVNATADFAAANCSTVSGRSAYELNASDIGTGQQLRILGLVDAPGNAFGENADVLVEFAECAATSNTSV